MHLSGRRRYVAISVLAVATLFVLLASPAAAGRTQLTAAAAGDDTQTKSIEINGADIVAINQFVKSTFHFSPGTLRVHQGDSLVLTNNSTDVHTFSLVDPTLLPVTFGDVFNCGAPGTICAAVAAAHFPNGPPMGPGAPSICGPVPVGQCVVPIVDGGSAGSPPLGLDTPFTLSTGGDSEVIGPAGSPFAAATFTITASPGTVLHFMCVIHPWMQGQLVVVAPSQD